MKRIDPHSFSNPDEVCIRNLSLDLVVDFDKKQIFGKAILKLDRKKKDADLILDAGTLIISRVFLDGSTEAAKYSLSERDRVLGRELQIPLKPDTSTVQVEYSTAPDAAALQWLTPEQTAAKKLPYLFTQSQAILARTWVPCQDTPSVRMTYQARVKVPQGMLAVMSAENPTEKNSSGLYEFRMPQPIPSYLLALAVGDIQFHSTGRRTGIYAEPPLLEKAAYEFAETEKMMESVERLYGPYQWGRYDLLVLPPSFPWGGMENPRLTFITPVLVVGDRSLVSTIAHELAHSWSGNLVTNATWNDFWLNEGFTSYLTDRIMEVVYGKEDADMLGVLSFQDMQKEVRILKPVDTLLKLQLQGRDPEEGVTNIAYDKGQFFLRTIEKAVGREKFDAFLKGYFANYAFRSIPTEEFLEYLQEHLIRGNEELAKQLQIDAWVYQPGIPSNAVSVSSESFLNVEKDLDSWSKGKKLQDIDTKSWSTQEWMHFLRSLPDNTNLSQMAELDSTFGFSKTSNMEILNEWLLQVIQKNYKPAYPGIERLLTSNGRRKYVREIFTELVQTPEGETLARQLYEKAKPTYHSVTREVAERILRVAGKKQ